jgi:NADPH:quinone reductase-like Zn-dependent oxidoreductase
MKSAIFATHGAPDVIRIADIPRPRPAPGELLIGVRACGLNHLDLWVRRGLPIETTMPHIGGSDIAGVIAEIGDDIEGWRVGERVVVNPALWCGECEWCRRGEHSMCDTFRILGEHTNGGFAEYVAVPADHAYRLPESYPFEKAAALPVSYQTAWRAVVSRARVTSGDDVLVLGASGATAAACVQISKLLGARVFAVTSGSRSVERARAIGADVVYDRERQDFSREVFKDTEKRGVDVVIENVGEPTWKGSVRALARGGRLVTYGATAGPNVVTDARTLFWKQLEILGTTMANRAEFEAMLDAALAGKIDPVIDVVMPLDSAREAHERLEEGRQFGKIVLVP